MSKPDDKKPKTPAEALSKAWKIEPKTGEKPKGLTLPSLDIQPGVAPGRQKKP